MSRGEIVIVSMFKRHTIQVIDDDASIRDSTKLLLELFGFSVELFESATCLSRRRCSRKCRLPPARRAHAGNDGDLTLKKSCAAAMSQSRRLS